MICPLPMNWSPFGTTAAGMTMGEGSGWIGGATTEEVLIISIPSILDSSTLAGATPSSKFEGAALISATCWIEFSISLLNWTLLILSWLGLISLSTGVVSKFISKCEGNTEYRWGGIVLKVFNFLICSGICCWPGITLGIVLPSVFEKVC